MIIKRSLIAAFAILACLMFAWATGAGRPYPATAGGVIDPTCVSSLPCIEYDNNGTGPAIRGIALNGNGVNGQTFFNSTSAANSREGVFGNDMSTSGLFNSGVRGLSAHGIGVLGESTGGFGVSGSGSTGIVGNGQYGVSAVGSLVGVFGHGPVGIAGTNTSSATSDSVLAFGNGGRLFRGHNSHSVDVFSVDDGGNMNLTGTSTVGGNLILTGTSPLLGNANIAHILTAGISKTDSFGVFAYGTGDAVVGDYVGTSGSGAGVYGQALGTATFPSAGVVGQNNSSTIAVLAQGFGGPLFIGTATSVLTPVVVFKVDGSGNVHAHSFTADLAAATGQKVVTYAPQASEPTIEDFGEAQLTNGSAYVHIDNRFAGTMARGVSYLVFITPEGDNRGLYVSQKSADGFTVRESQGGHSSLAFGYRIVAKPFGNQAPRLPLEVEVRVPRHVPRFHR